MSDYVPVKRALISVSNKDGIVAFAQALAQQNIEIVSTGGTAKILRQAGMQVLDVADVTGFPEMMDGRIKTLHPFIHGGLLARRDDTAHLQSMQQHTIVPIDLLVVNLYPFEQIVQGKAAFDVCIENIDIGGPAMVRAAAKNHAFVGVVTDSQDYPTVLEEMQTHAGLSQKSRCALAAKAFAHTAHYDTQIANWFAQERDITSPTHTGVSGQLIQTLRYGENPHQAAAFYRTGEARPGVATAQKMQGKALSYNNINDTDAAFELVAELGQQQAGVAIIKHANPCGVAVADTCLEAYRKALQCDPVSAFGGIVALNQTLDAPTAKHIMQTFTEVVIAPGATPEALDLFKEKKNLRLLITTGVPDPAMPGHVIKPVAGGFLYQSRDNGQIQVDALTVVTRRTPSADEMRDLVFAFKVAKHVKSNAIVYAKNQATVGIGAGQMSRLDSSRIAARKAQDASEQAGLTTSLAVGSVVASDAFFPFPDGLLAAAAAGARAVIQPGGSIKDDEVIAAADEAGLAMIFTGMRHFRH